MTTPSRSPCHFPCRYRMRCALDHRRIGLGVRVDSMRHTALAGTELHFPSGHKPRLFPADLTGFAGLACAVLVSQLKRAWTWVTKKTFHAEAAWKEEALRSGAHRLISARGIRLPPTIPTRQRCTAVLRHLRCPLPSRPAMTQSERPQGRYLNLHPHPPRPARHRPGPPCPTLPPIHKARSRRMSAH